MKWTPPSPKTFPAAFASEIGCGCEVDEGDEIGYDNDDVLCCAFCLED